MSASTARLPHGGKEPVATKLVTVVVSLAILTFLAILDELGTNLPVLSMAWILQHPEISCVIAGASKPGQLENNLKASGFQIPADAMAEIDRITGFHRFERHVG